ncbi:glycerophosphoryl diester phosphodiesterase [Legionella wadsworthii]|uniref:Glycerophosphoryl diester phosphodiesterase n=1 Tax=Legionella wadsworthii TaxID=28088 RepID=A0A378M317_9GAMM|nr:glycerophosphodiester phosphodiesterase family protein [Legionella wadsworthii]STY31762.1 glycerophosphoryl diester phosphodiesterase [Legionella wadsworthii]
MLLDWLQKTIDGYFALLPRPKPSMNSFQSSRVIAHRGAHHHANGIIENTLAAFSRAKELGCWGIEFDVRATSDKVLVVNHDATLRRLWGYDRSIAAMNFNELRALVPGIPTLDEVIAAYGDSMHLFIELKTPFYEEEVLKKALSGLSAGVNYHLLTLDASIFYSLSQFPKNALLLVAGHNNVNEFCRISLKENYGGILGHYCLINSRIIHQFQEAKKIVGVGMVDSQNSLYRELNRGINWLFTNRAEKLNLYLRPSLHAIK